MQNNRCWLQLSAGKGPLECSFLAAKVLKIIEKELIQNNINFKVLDIQEDEKAHCYKSVLLSLEGQKGEEWLLKDFLSRWAGTVKWQCQSPFRPKHKRKNWFMGIEAFTEPDKLSWNEQDIKVELYRSSGPGGQHVNKTETAVRVTHIPTGFRAIAQEERSQRMNLALAKLRLMQELSDYNIKIEREQNQQKWQKHQDLERGNPKITFVGLNFSEQLEQNSSKK